MEKITSSARIPIRIRADHRVIEVQNREASLSIFQRRRGVLRPMRLRHARIGDAVRVLVDDETEVVVLEDGGDCCVVCFCEEENQ